ncbi:protein kinase [Mycobacterium kubicae]|uniref:non-specific serine/threonine protein kinase n=1 Tax=Mycobacterium kubicae TaxID=120959 RepID=A0AAX1J3Y6_9MYCO|nr:serine/threonine-protein kinase [Mycobacterium kubicae]MCV7094152.1 serine/threonine protein kinase [Mycobacterium kubicae]ORV98493.1 protein kinase [Mycobacterium kubicae]QNI12588.1 serine/threonine protein kinase [Mycobacterium kubicae]QPI36111.1 serine/threonine protein kinase [Mycobacterium kubicae]GFG68036.1 protein kinase [Mycobacterium kubicae]
MSSPYRGPRLGTRFGPYELRSLIGEGAMGQVYRAYDTTKDREVALKLLRTELATDPSFQKRFRRESQLAARLQEPHVIPVHDFGQIDGVLFIDMRLVNGASLKELLRERGELEPREAASIIAQVAAALDAAHADGLVHRDVKPENVLLTRNNFAYLVDFGIAHGRGDAGMTANGLVIGSCAYMAPERFNGGRVGPHTDVYSLACVLYECLTGRPPFDGEDLQELISAHMFVPPPRPSIMRRGIDRSFDQVIARGMAKQPGARYISAGELARAATAAASPGLAPSEPTGPSGTRPFEVSYPNPEDTGFTPYAPPPPPARAAVPPRRVGRTPVVVGAFAGLMLIVAAILGGILAFGNKGGSPAQPSAAGSPSVPTSVTRTPSLSGSVQGADGLGFVGHTARCSPGNPPAAVLRTAQSLVVVCQTGDGGLYYRGERIRDGANIELSNTVRSADGFVATNPDNGVRYEIGPQRLTILSNGHVDSAEPVLQYATAR